MCSLLSRAGLQQPIIGWSGPQRTFVPFKPEIMAPIAGFTSTTCYLAPSVGQSCWKRSKIGEYFCCHQHQDQHTRWSSCISAPVWALVLLHRLFIHANPRGWVEQVPAPVFAVGVRLSFRLSVGVVCGKRGHSCASRPLPASVVKVFTALGLFS